MIYVIIGSMVLFIIAHIAVAIAPIKFVNADIKDNIIELCLENYNDFIDLLVYITDNSLANTKQVEIFIKLNYFKQFGGNEKLLTVYREFKDGKLHPVDLKNAVADGIIQILKPIQKERKVLEKLEKEAYS